MNYYGGEEAFGDRGRALESVEEAERCRDVTMECGLVILDRLVINAQYIVIPPTSGAKTADSYFRPHARAVNSEMVLSSVRRHLSPVPPPRVQHTDTQISVFTEAATTTMAPPTPGMSSVSISLASSAAYKLILTCHTYLSVLVFQLERKDKAASWKEEKKNRRLRRLDNAAHYDQRFVIPATANFYLFLRF